MTFLQLFLLVNIFLVGALTTLAIQHGYAHFRPHEAEKPHPGKPALPPSVRERMQQQAADKFQAMLDHSLRDLEKQLQTTTTDLTKRLEKVGTDTIGSEMQRYQSELTELRKQSEATIGGAETDITEHQKELKAQLDAEMTAEKERLVAQIDTKLADAVASFLLEALQHNVDLGAQSTYLTALLEEHKEEFKQGVTSGS